MKLQYQGKMIEVEEVEALSSDEKWNSYKLADGKWISTKLVLVKVCKALTEKTPDGDTLYIVNAQTIVKVK